MSAEGNVPQQLPTLPMINLQGGGQGQPQQPPPPVPQTQPPPPVPQTQPPPQQPPVQPPAQEECEGGVCPIPEEPQESNFLGVSADELNSLLAQSKENESKFNVMEPSNLVCLCHAGVIGPALIGLAYFGGMKGKITSDNIHKVLIGIGFIIGISNVVVLLNRNQ